MERLKIFLLLPIFILSCKNQRINNIQNKSNTKLGVAKTEKKQNRVGKSFKKNEYISIDSITVDGKIPFKGDKKLLRFFDKKIDSMNKYGYECDSEFEEKNVIYYYGKTKIEITESQYCFRTVDFTKEGITFLLYKDFKFSKNYTLDSFIEEFPNTYKNNSFQNKDGLIEIYISNIDNEMSDTTIKFYFENRKLIRMIYFIPC